MVMVPIPYAQCMGMGRGVWLIHTNDVGGRAGLVHRFTKVAQPLPIGDDSVETMGRNDRK